MEISADEAGQLLWEAVFAAACRDHKVCRVGKFDHPLSDHGRRKIRLWQAACSLVAFVPDDSIETVALQIFDMLVVSPWISIFRARRLLLLSLSKRYPTEETR